MTGEVNRVPAGLLSLLDMKARGQAPRLLASELSGSIELLDLYLAQRRRAATGSSSPANLEGTWAVNIVVPQTELWYVHNYSVTHVSNLNAGTTYEVGLGIRQYQAITSAFDQLYADPRSYVSGERISMGVQGPFLALPGASFLVHVNEFTAGTAVTFDGIVDYTPLDL